MSSDGILARFHMAWPGFTLDVDLDLPGRGITALFGHSGSGKTTVLRCIAGLERATGQLVIRGETWQDEHTCLPTHRRSLGYVFQEASLFPHLNVRHNLEYGLRRNRHRHARARLEQAIELLGIAPLLARRPRRLSGGERQRVAIARALAADPSLLLMDEPLAALDLARKQEILPFLERLHDELDIPVLYVTHSPDEVARLADQLVVMDAGRTVASGPIGEILSRLDLPVRLGEEAGVVLQARITERDSQWHLARAEFEGGSLWVRDMDIAVGQPVRLRVLARDVSLALARQQDTSILNLLPGVVAELAEGEQPGTMLVRVDMGATPVLCRLTSRSVQALSLAPGKPVWVQIKSVAIIE